MRKNTTARHIGAPTTPAGKDGSAGRQAVETFRIRRGLDGWHLVPANPQNHPLLALLFGHEDVAGTDRRLVLDDDDLRLAFAWTSLSEGLALIREVARGTGLRMRATGNLNRAPTVQVWKAPPMPPQVALRPFAALQGDASHSTVVDFYPAHEQALRDALASKAAFDTGWYGVKKEVQSGRVTRQRAGGRVKVEVSASMDALPDLLDTAIWKCLGASATSRNGLDALIQLGLTMTEADSWMAQVEREASQAFFSCESGLSRTLSHQVGFDRLIDVMRYLASSCETELEDHFAGLVEACERRVKALREQLGLGGATAPERRTGLA